MNPARFKRNESGEWRTEHAVRSLRECSPAMRAASAGDRPTIVVQASDVAKIVAKDREIARLERELQRYKSDATKEATQLLSRVVGLTTEIFGKNVRISESFDPSFASDKYVVLKVYSEMTPDEVVRAEQEWTKRLIRISPHWNALRLLVYPR